MKYLVTHFYSEHEIPFLKLNFLESENHIDKFVIVEFNHTKRGHKKEFVDLYKYDIFSKEDMEKISYHKINIDDKIVDASEDDKKSRDLMAINNEPLLRSYFVNLIDFKDEDIIVAVDADEIIYGEKYENIFRSVQKFGTVKLKLHSFYYKLTNYNSTPWVAAIATKYKLGKNFYDENSHGKTRYPQFRGCTSTEKVNITSFVGCHFSWCMKINKMVNKLNSIGCGVSMKFKEINNEKFLEDAVKNKQYFCKEKNNFTLTELSIDNKIYPKKLKQILHMFEGLY